MPEFGDPTADAQYDALHTLGQMMQGQPGLANEPGALYALQQAQATPAQAQTIGQFMQGLEAQKKVALARASGNSVAGLINLSDDEKSMLDQMGVAYNDVLFTPQKQADRIQQEVLDKSNGTETVKRNPDGSLATDKNGQLVIQKLAPPSHHDDGDSGFWGTIGHAVSSAAGTVAGAVADVGKEAWHVAGDVADAANKAWHVAESVAQPITNYDDPNKGEAQVQDMESQGYDSGSIFSHLAYLASGKSLVDDSALRNKYGDDKVNDALHYLNDPKGFEQKLVAGITYVKNADGSETPDAASAARLKYYNSGEWHDLALRVSAQRNTVGNFVARSLRLDPTRDDNGLPGYLGNPITFQKVSAASELAAQWFADPTVVALKAREGVKMSQVAINGLGDGYGAASVLTRGGYFAGKVQRGWQRAIDLSADMRKAYDEGDHATVSKLTAQFQTELPGLTPIMDEFVGRNVLMGSGVDEAGKTIRAYNATDGIRNLDEAAEWVTRNNRLFLLSYGKAAQQTTVMPGMLSAFGYRKLRGAMTGWLTTRSEQRLSHAYDAATSRLNADPLIAEKWVDAGLAERMAPQADDAWDFHAADNNSPVVTYKPGRDAILGELVGSVREGRVEQNVAKAFGDELDGLESQLQAAMADKATDPEKLAKLHDYITEGRALLAQAEQGAKVSFGEAKDLQRKLGEVEKSINPENSRAFEWKPKDYADNASAPKSVQRGAQAGYKLTEAGKGAVQHGKRMGDVLAGGFTKDGEAIVDTAYLKRFSPSAVNERFHLAASRLGQLLPRNNQLDILDASSGDKIYKFARTYLGRADAAQYRAMWNFADAAGRKRLIEGVVEQVGHSAGLAKTQAGREILARSKNLEQTYVSNGGPGIRIAAPGGLGTESVALTAGQTRTVWNIPSFQLVQQAAHKIGLYEATLGKIGTAEKTDQLLAQWKLGALFKPSTVTRNQLEGWLRVGLEGRVGEAIKARVFATARNKELWERGVGQDALDRYTAAKKQVDYLTGLAAKDRPKTYAKDLAAARADIKLYADHAIVKHHEAVEAGDVELAKQIANATMLSGEILGRSSFAAKLVGEIAPSSKKGHALAYAGVPFVLAGRAWRSMHLKHMDQATLDALATLSPDDLARFMEGYSQQILEGTLGFANAADHATKATSAGLGAAHVKYIVSHGLARSAARAEAKGKTGAWTLQAADDTIGADRYANHLHRLVDAQPDATRAVLDHLSAKLNGETTSLDPIVSALEYEAKHTGFGRHVADDPESGIFREAVNADEVALGKQQWANELVKELEYCLTGRNGHFQMDLADYIKAHGVAPDGEWISRTLKGDQRPELMAAPEIMAMVPGGLRSLPQTLLDVEGAAYQWVVERLLQRTTSSPVFLAMYADARKGLNGEVDRLIRDAGLSRPAAEKLAQEKAVRQAWIKTEQLIDDPGQKAQFDVVARNFFPFSRATSAMLRRWGSGLWQNPVAARKAMLAYEGAEHAGLIYTNNYGEPTFVYPVSGAMNMALREISKLPYVGDLAQFPIAGDMTGSTLLAVPGADNPFRLSAGPMVTMPLRIVYENFLPQSARSTFEDLDAAFNGPVGVGEVWPQLLPTVARHFYQNVLADDRNSALASSTNGAIAYLAAAGLVPPPDAPARVIKQFQARLHTQIRNQLYLRFAFGLFAPAAPSKPDEVTEAGKADFLWNHQGVQGLSDEYKAILNDVNGDTARATAIFTAMHPDTLVYKDDGSVEKFAPTASAIEEGESQSTTKGAQLVSTKDALKWYEANADFIKTYKSVAAYFIPKASNGQPFSQAAYDMQIEMGLRQRKAPDEFMADVYTRNEEGAYYSLLDGYDAKIAAAKAAGNTDLAKQLTDQKSVDRKAFLARNPFMQQKLDSYPAARKVAGDQLRDLRDMVKQGAVPGGNARLLSDLIQSWDGFRSFMDDPSKTDGQKKAARKILNDWVSKHIAFTPLADVWNGVFRALDNNFDQAGEGLYE